MVAGGDFADGEDYDPWKAEMKYKFEHLHRSNSARDMLKYFKEWSKGEVRHRAQVHKNLDHHLGASLLGVDQGVSASYVANVLGSHRELFCPGAANEKTAGGWKGDATSLGDKWRLHSTSTDVEGVHHALLLSSGGRPHYVAMLDGRVLSSDPPACPHGRGLLHEAALLENRSLNFTHRGELPNANAGEQELLDDHDPLAQDAVIDFRHFYKKTCGTNIDVTILSAQVEIIDGVEAIVTAGELHEHQDAPIALGGGHLSGGGPGNKSRDEPAEGEQADAPRRTADEFAAGQGEARVRFVHVCCGVNKAGTGGTG